MKFPGFGTLNSVSGILPASGGLSTITGLILGLINYGIIAIVVISFFMLLWGGIRWIMSGGDKQGLAGAKATVTYAMIALVLGFLVFLILRIISGAFQFDLGAGVPSGPSFDRTGCLQRCAGYYSDNNGNITDVKNYNACIVFNCTQP